MKYLVSNYIKKNPVYYHLRILFLSKYNDWKLKKWELNDTKGIPPNGIKQNVLKEYADQYDLKVFIETGTYYGDTIQALKKDFDKIYSIELDQYLYEKAKKRFKLEKHIEIIQGDSSERLGEILKKINQPALFWLDGHYSGGLTARGDKDTPIYTELEKIFDSQDLGHVIVIDDARCFGIVSNYPTIDELKKFIESRRKNVIISIQYDSIRITPNT